MAEAIEDGRAGKYRALRAGGSVPAYTSARARSCRESLVFGRYTSASEPFRLTSLAHDGGIAAGDIFRMGSDGKVVVEQGDGLQVSGIQATPSEGLPRAIPAADHNGMF